MRIVFRFWNLALILDFRTTTFAVGVTFSRYVFSLLLGFLTFIVCESE